MQKTISKFKLIGLALALLLLIGTIPTFKTPARAAGGNSVTKSASGNNYEYDSITSLNKVSLHLMQASYTIISEMRMQQF